MQSAGNLFSVVVRINCWNPRSASVWLSESVAQARAPTPLAAASSGGQSSHRTNSRVHERLWDEWTSNRELHCPFKRFKGGRPTWLPSKR